MHRLGKSMHLCPRCSPRIKETKKAGKGLGLADATAHRPHQIDPTRPCRLLHCSRATVPKLASIMPGGRPSGSTNRWLSQECGKAEQRRTGGKSETVDGDVSISSERGGPKEQRAWASCCRRSSEETGRRHKEVNHIT